MKKTKSFLLITLAVTFLVSGFPYNNPRAAAYDEPGGYEPKDIACVYIYTDNDIIKESYSDCKVVVVDKEGGEYEIVSDDEARIKIRGNSTSSGLKKPYNFKFSSKTDLFGMGRAKKWCLLANCYEKTLIRNKLVYDFADTIGMDYVAETHFVDVYINGSYKGNYLLTEAVEAGPTRVDIDTDGEEVILELEPYAGYSNPICFRTPRYNILLGYNDPDEPTSKLVDFVNSFFGDAEKALATKKKEEIEVYYDIKSFIDTYIVQEYFKNVDFNTSSTRYYIKGGKLYAGPVWDFDLSAGNCSDTFYKEYCNYYTTGNSWEGFYCQKQWYKVLLTCGWFTNMLTERFLELQDLIVNLYADNILGGNYIDRVVSENIASFNRNYTTARWSVSRIYSALERVPDADYQTNVEFLRSWLEKRNKWMLEYWGFDSKYPLLPSAGSPYKVDGMVITNVPPNTLAAVFLSDFPAESKLVKNGEPVISSLVRTGDCITAGGPSYEIAVSGDTDGDGALTITDYIVLKLHILDVVQLGGVYRTAADFNGDGSVNETDYKLISLKLLKISD